MIIIAAMTNDGLIGSGRGMPWTIPEEFSQFLDFITDQTVIIGRTSYEIFGSHLTCKHAIVLSGSSRKYPDATVCSTLNQALDIAGTQHPTIYIADGATVYSQVLPLAHKMYISYIKGQYTGDTYFPEFTESNWLVEKADDFPRFKFVIYGSKRLVA